MPTLREMAEAEGRASSPSKVLTVESSATKSIIGEPTLVIRLLSSSPQLCQQPLLAPAPPQVDLLTTQQNFYGPILHCSPPVFNTAE